ncbi:HAD family hydrolase [Anaerobacillus alkaliphilus]|uniref:HAD family hydrolase n=1 Tax=Anaerobacillus alkaliphilus TaxID=1548597 RepID=A0A4Q0VTQ2_9BACI|nr:HAD family hydrolase [Anaerobacillus alkaliphilus]RXI99454.1 HAD family hydrolase [Anaerobacillus alkaliphilus]
MTMRWKTICFDLDNTLFSHEKAFEDAICFCFNSIIRNKNLTDKVSTKEWFPVFKKYSDLFWSDYEAGVITAKEYRRKRFLQSALHFQLPFTTSEADEFHNHYFFIVDDFSEPYPSLHTMMQTLVTANVKVGIITNGTADTQSNKINKLNLTQWLSNDCIFISEELKVFKPKREIFDLAKSRLQSDGGYLFVGDSWEHDVVGAINAGWDAIFLNTRSETPKSNHKPVYTSGTLAEVASFIYQENNLKG